MSMPRHVLMTVDAVGGVWRYGIDLCAALNAAGIRVLLVCLGPAPRPDQEVETGALPATRLVLLDEPLDWLARTAAELRRVPERLQALAAAAGVDLLHLNGPSQAAGLQGDWPVAVVMHSCLPSWWNAMRTAPLPPEWEWQRDLTRRGLDRADVVIAPTNSQAAALRQAYGWSRAIQVVPNAAAPMAPPTSTAREDRVFAAARWWDEGKNAVLLDAAAARLDWPVDAAGACHGDNGQAFVFRHVQALGPLPHREVRQRMGRAAIFASPSRYEPFGLAALEAAQAGAALVLADIPTYRELWHDAALFAGADDPAAFAQALDRLARDPGLRREIAERAAERATHFTPRRQLDALLASYEAARAMAVGV